MNQQTLDAWVTLGVWGLILGGCIWIFGARRTLLFLGLLVLISVTIAFRTIAGIAGNRRY